MALNPRDQISSKEMDLNSLTLAEICLLYGVSFGEANRLSVQYASTHLPLDKFKVASSSAGTGRQRVGNSVLMVMFGEFPPSQGIIDIYGDAGVGKTQVCLDAALQYKLMFPTSSVCYIYTEGSFPSDRLSQMCGGSPCDLLDSMLVKHVDDWTCLRDGLKTIEESTIVGIAAPPLLVIDSIAAPLRVLNRDCRGRAINLIVRDLNRLCRKQHFRVLCTNQMTQRTDGLSEASLGYAWKNALRSRIRIERTNRTSERTGAVIRRMTADFSADVILLKELLWSPGDTSLYVEEMWTE